MGVELVERVLSGIELAGHTYSVVGSMPRSTVVLESKVGDSLRFMAAHSSGTRQVAGCCWHVPKELLRVLVLSCEPNTDEPSSLINADRLDEDVVFADLMSRAPAETVLRRLHERASALRLGLRATLLEIEGEDHQAAQVAGDKPAEAEDDDEDGDFAVMNAYTAGLPPLVLIGAAGFSFPVRSGLPAGVLPEWFTQKQTLEWQRGEQVFCHTDLPGSNSGRALRGFHTLLKDGAPLTELPDDLVLLKVTFEA